MVCQRYALFVGDNGRKVTQPLHTEGDAPRQYTCRDGTVLPLVMVARYHEDTQHTSHVELVMPPRREPNVVDALDAMQARVRAQHVRRAS